MTTTEPMSTTTARTVATTPKGLPRSERGVDPSGGPRRVRVGVIGATGYVGAELIRLLSRHPNVELVGLTGRGRDHDPIVDVHPHLALTDQAIHAELPAVDAAFLALPHGAAAALVPGLIAEGTAVIDQGPDFRLRDPADYPRWYGFEHPDPGLLDQAVYGLPELHRTELQALVDAPVAIVGAPGCYPTATVLALAPLARAGLIGDLVVDAKSGVSGAGREAKADLMFGEVNESVKAYGIGGHRHVAEIEQELAVVTKRAGLDADANRRAFRFQQVDNILRRAVAEQLAERLFMIGDAMFAHERQEISGPVSRQRGFGKMPVCRKKIFGLCMKVGEIASATARDQDLAANLRVPL